MHLTTQTNSEETFMLLSRKWIASHVDVPSNETADQPLQTMFLVVSIQLHQQKHLGPPSKH